MESRRLPAEDIGCQPASRVFYLPGVAQEAGPEKQFPSRTEGRAGRKTNPGLVDDIERRRPAVGYAVNLEKGVKGAVRL